MRASQQREERKSRLYHGSITSCFSLRQILKILPIHRHENADISLRNFPLCMFNAQYVHYTWIPINDLSTSLQYRTNLVSSLQPRRSITNRSLRNKRKKKQKKRRNRPLAGMSTFYIEIHPGFRRNRYSTIPKMFWVSQLKLELQSSFFSFQFQYLKPPFWGPPGS